MSLGVSHTHVTYVPRLNEGISKNIHHLVETLGHRGIRATIRSPEVEVGELNGKATYIRKGLECIERLNDAHRDEAVDLLHFHLSIPAMGLLARLSRRGAARRKPLVGHAWNPFVTAADASRGGAVESTYHLLFNNPAIARAAMRTFDALVVSSRYQEAQVRVNGYKGPVHVIPNGVAVDEYRPATAAEKRHAREELGLPDDGPVILYYGHLTPWKGAHVLVEAIPHIAEAHPDAHFVIAHTPYGNHADALRASLRNAGAADRVTWIGNTHVPTLLHAADLGVVPMVGAVGTACHPNVVLEYMGAGVPIIASDCGSIPEAVVHGRTGLLAEPGNPADLAAKLSDLLSDAGIRETMAKASRARALETFAWPGIAERVEAVYEGIMDRPRDLPQKTPAERARAAP